MTTDLIIISSEWLTGSFLFGAYGTYLLVREIKKCREQAREYEETIKQHKRFMTHHALINKKLPIAKLESIKITEEKKSEQKTNDTISLKFTAKREKIKEVRNNEITENRRLGR
jgi:hypothetical protein